MKQEVITAIFKVESEAYQAFSEIRQAPATPTYAVSEGSLLKREGDAIKLIDAFDTGVNSTDDTAFGLIIGSITGVLGGPLGVLLGASTGAFVGSMFDLGDAASTTSLIEVTAAKLYEGEIAIIAMVKEDEGAFDAALEKYETTIIRYGPEDVADEVERAIETVDEMENLARQQLRAKRKAERKTRRSDRMAALRARYDELVGRNDAALAELQVKMEDHEEKVDAKMGEIDQALAEKKEKLDEALDIANAQFESSTQEMLGSE